MTENKKASVLKVCMSMSLCLVMCTMRL